MQYKVGQLEGNSPGYCRLAALLYISDFGSESVGSLPRAGFGTWSLIVPAFEKPLRMVRLPVFPLRSSRRGFFGDSRLQTPDLDGACKPRPLACYALLAISWLMLAFGLFVVSSPCAGALALITTITALALAFGKTALLKRLLPAALIFCMIIPLPWNLDQLAVSGLQSLTAKESGQVLDILGVPNIVEAHSVKLPTTTLQVEEGCSGINSLFTILITALLYVCWMKRPLFRSILLLLAAVGAMMVANVMRVVAVGYIAHQFDRDWSAQAGDMRSLDCSFSVWRSCWSAAWISSCSWRPRPCPGSNCPGWACASTGFCKNEENTRPPPPSPFPCRCAWPPVSAFPLPCRSDFWR